MCTTKSGYGGGCSAAVKITDQGIEKLSTRINFEQPRNASNQTIVSLRSYLTRDTYTHFCESIVLHAFYCCFQIFRTWSRWHIDLHSNLLWSYSDTLFIQNGTGISWSRSEPFTLHFIYYLLKNFTLLLGLISFTSPNQSNYYLRHSGFVLWLQQYDGSDIFNSDGSFYVRPGISLNSFAYWFLITPKGFMNGSYSSFESINFPGYFLRQSNNRITLDQNSNTLDFWQQCSFEIVRPLVIYHPNPLHFNVN